MKFRFFDTKKHTATAIIPYVEDSEKENILWRRIVGFHDGLTWSFALLLIGWYNMIMALAMAVMSVLNNSYRVNFRFAGLFYAADCIWLFESVGLCVSLAKAKRRMRCVWLTTVMILSVLPIEQIDPLLGVNRILKLFYSAYLFSNINETNGTRLVVRYIQVVYWLCLAISIMTLAFAVDKCFYRQKCDSMSSSDYFQLFVVVADHMTTRGYGLLGVESEGIKLMIILAGFLTFFWIFNIQMAHLTYTFYEFAERKNWFHYRMKGAIKYFQLDELPQFFMKHVEKYFRNMWEMNYGNESHMADTRLAFNSTELEYLLPKSLVVEACTDIYWSFFEHSIIFKNLSLPVIQELSFVIKLEIYSKGQFIYEQGRAKNRMVYINYGLVNILNKEDGETPLITLTSGSCIGESSLVIPQVCSSGVQCGSVCVVKVLEQRDFIRVVKKYPHDYKRINHKIWRRYGEFRLVNNFQKVANENMFGQCMSVVWLCYVLHKIMASRNKAEAERHAITRIKVSREVNDKIFAPYLFSAKHLQLYSVPPRLSYTADKFFYKSSLLHCFKPDTFLTLIWELFICIAAMIVIAVYPYYILLSADTIDLKIFNFIVTFIWWLDIGAQCLTAVHLKYLVISNFRQILVYRLTQFYFLMDIFSALPIEYLSAILIYHEYGSFLILNRCIKIYRLFKFLQSLERRYNVNLIIVRILIVPSVLVTFTFFTGACFAKLKCKYKCDEYNILQAISMVELLTGICTSMKEFLVPETYPFLHSATFIIAGSALCVFQAYTLSSFKLNTFVHLTIRTNLKNYSRLLRNVDPTLSKRIAAHVRLKYETCNGLEVVHYGYIFSSIPRPLVGYILSELHLGWISYLPIFSYVPKHVISAVFQKSGNLEWIPPGETVVREGEVFEDLIILVRGECVRLSNYSDEKVITDRALNPLEIYMSIPATFRVISITHCELLTLDFDPIRNYMMKHHVKLPKVLSTEKIIAPVNLKFKPSKIRGNFIWHRKRGSCFEPPLYRNILMPVTIIPSGKFYWCFECFYCCCAIMSAFLHPMKILFNLPLTNPITWFLYFLNIRALVGIYLRLHLCYYNKQGLLITDPLKTAKHYIETSACVDLFAMMPNFDNIFLAYTKLLQVYRYIFFVRVQASNRVLCNKFNIFLYLPIFFVTVNAAASLILYHNCNTDIKDINDPAKCTHFQEVNEQVANIMNETILRFQSYIFYIVLNNLSSATLQILKSHSSAEMIQLNGITMLGFWLNLFLISVFASYYYISIKSEILNEFNRKHLDTFLKFAKAGAGTRLHVYKFLKITSLQQKHNVFNIVTVPAHLQKDILFAKFGSTLEKYCLIDSPEVGFLMRNCLPKSKYTVLPRNAYVFTINDVVEDVHIVYSGIVELISNCEVVTCTLSKGSIIGNLYNKPYNKMLVSAVACTNVEILSIKSTDFFNYFSMFPTVNEQFNLLKDIHGYHIPGYFAEEEIKIAIANHKDIEILSETYKHFSISMFLLIAGAYSPILIYFYQVAVSEFSTILLVSNLTGDCLYFAAIMWELFRHTLALNSKSPYLYIYAFAAIPFYLCFFGTHKTMTGYYTLVAVKSNVLIRYLFFYKYFHRHLFLYKIKFLYYRCITITVRFFIICFGATAALLFFSEFSKPNMKMPIDRETLIHSNATYRFQVFVNRFYLVSNYMTRNSQFSDFPVNVYSLFLVTVIAFTLTILSSLIVGNIIALVIAEEKINNRYTVALGNIKNLMRLCAISEPLRKRIFSYAVFVWIRCRGFKEPEMLRQLPQYLQESIFRSAIGKLINASPIFRYTHIDLLRQIYPKIKFEYYLDGSIIQAQGIVDPIIYFVMSGKVAVVRVLQDGTEEIIRYLAANDNINYDTGLYKHLAHRFMYRAVEDSCIATLVLSEWKYLLDYFPASKGIIYTRLRTINLPDVALMNSVVGSAVS